MSAMDTTRTTRPLQPSTARYVARLTLRRLAALAVLLLILSFGVFSLLYLAPGSAEEVILGTQPRSPETVAALREEYHLDEPFLTQYWLWVKDAAQLDFGRSLATSQPVWEGIRERLAVSIWLALYAFALTLIFGLGLGVLSATRANSGLDRGVVGLSVVGVSAPAFASGVLLLYLLAVKWQVFPAFGAGSGFVGRLSHLTLPAIALALGTMAVVLKLTRTAMIHALRQDYVTFARARGLPRRRVILAYGLRNALVTIVTSAGLVLAYLFTGAVLVESAFSLPGMGQLLIQSVQLKDLPMVQGVTLLLAALVVAINLLTDIAYVLIDPRIRFEGAMR